MHGSQDLQRLRRDRRRTTGAQMEGSDVHGSQDLQCLRRDRRRTTGAQMAGGDVYEAQDLQCLRRNRGRAVRPCRRGLGSHKRADLHLSEEVPATGHTPGEDWEIIEEATSTSAGTRAKVCVNCGEQLETESYELSEEEKEEAYKDECESYSYEEIARDPDDYKGDKAKFTGKVVQVMQEGNTYTLRVNITKTRWGYDDTILVYYEAQKGASRILEDDIVTMYGMLGGTYTYKTVMGNSLTVPLLYAKYISIE